MPRGPWTVPPPPACLSRESPDRTVQGEGLKDKAGGGAQHHTQTRHSRLHPSRPQTQPQAQSTGCRDGQSDPGWSHSHTHMDTPRHTVTHTHTQGHTLGTHSCTVTHTQTHGHPDALRHTQEPTLVASQCTGIHTEVWTPRHTHAHIGADMGTCVWRTWTQSSSTNVYSLMTSWVPVHSGAVEYEVGRPQ